LDRDNWKAQKDPSCGLGGRNDLESRETWEKAVKHNFTLEHHPYMQIEETRDCMFEMSVNSLKNL